MKKLITTLVANGITLWVMDYFMADIYFADAKTLLSVALILGILNAVVRPILKFLAFPITFVTLGLFSLVINGIVLNMAFALGGAAKLPLLTAVISAIIFAVLNGIVGKLFD